MKNQFFPLAANVFVFCCIGVATLPSIAQEEPKAPPVIELPGEGGEQVKVALLSLLSYSYYLTGEFNFSRQYAEQTIAQYRSLTSTSKNEVLEPQVDRAKIILSWIKRWKEEPIVANSKILHFTLNNSETVAQQQVNLKTLSSVPLTVTSNNPAVKVHFLNQDESQKREYYFEKSMIVEVVPEMIVTDVEAIVEITSLQAPDFLLRLPVSVRAPTKISYPTFVSFGTVMAGETEVRVFKLTSSTPFRVLKLDFRDGSKILDSKTLQTICKVGEVATEHRVELKYAPASSDQSYSGKIRVLTDSYSQESIEIPFVAQTR